jgi:hypothetical protein
VEVAIQRRERAVEIIVAYNLNLEMRREMDIEKTGRRPRGGRFAVPRSREEMEAQLATEVQNGELGVVFQGICVGRDVTGVPFRYKREDGAAPVWEFPAPIAPPPTRPPADWFDRNDPDAGFDIPDPTAGAACAAEPAPGAVPKGATAARPLPPWHHPRRYNAAEREAFGMDDDLPPQEGKGKGKAKGKKGERAGSVPSLVNNIRDVREGDWTCPACHNVNFANKQFCHNRHCERPRPKGAGGKARPYGKGR